MKAKYLVFGFFVFWLLSLASVIGGKHRLGEEVFGVESAYNLNISNDRVLFSFKKPGNLSEEATVCFDILGCFEPGPTPLRKRLKILPKPLEHIATRFLLYTPESPDDAYEINWLPGNHTSIYSGSSKFDPSRKTVFFIHGYSGSKNTSSSLAIRKAFLETETVNFFLVDWSPGAKEKVYAQAAANAEVVGRQLGHFIGALMDIHGIDISAVYLVGFSLGAQVAGMAANHFSKIVKPGLMLPRITGLDPAGPEFYDGDYDSKFRLDSTDADYVDVIHTNGGLLASGHLSSLAPIGHVDYYPNGGSQQPGCSIPALANIETQLTAEGMEHGQCNHARAWEYFVASMYEKDCEMMTLPCGNPRTLFFANGRLAFADIPRVKSARKDFYEGKCFRCQRKFMRSFSQRKSVFELQFLDGTGGLEYCGKLGVKSVDTPARGIHFLLTNNKAPFCGSMYRMTVKSSYHQPHASAARTRGQLMLTLFSPSDGEAVGPAKVFRKDSWKLEAGASVTTIIFIGGSGALGLFDGRTPVAGQIQYIPSKLLSDVDVWNIDYIEIMDHHGYIMSARLASPLTSGTSKEIVFYPGRYMDVSGLDSVVSGDPVSTSIPPHLSVAGALGLLADFFGLGNV